MNSFAEYVRLSFICNCFGKTFIDPSQLTFVQYKRAERINFKFSTKNGMRVRLPKKVL